MTTVNSLPNPTRPGDKTIGSYRSALSYRLQDKNRSAGRSRANNRLRHNERYAQCQRAVLAYLENEALGKVYHAAQISQSDLFPLPTAVQMQAREHYGLDQPN